MHADELQDRGDVRGAILVLSRAQHERAHDRREVATIQRQIDELAWSRPDEIFGHRFASLPGARRALRCRWSAGMVREARLNARYLGKARSLAPIDLAHDLVLGPALSQLRCLWVRGSSATVTLNGLRQLQLVAPLEVIAVGPRPTPSCALFRGALADEVRNNFPRLQLLAVSDRLVPLGSSDGVAIARLQTTQMRGELLRRAIGRGLASVQPRVRAAALERLTSVPNLTLAFLPLLRLLLTPSYLADGAFDVVRALGELGRHALPLLPQLRAMTPRVGQFDAATRSAAGRLAHELSNLE